MAEEKKAAPKQAKRVVTLDDIKFNEENKWMAAISVIPLIGLIMFFVEKDDLFVRYTAAQYGILFLASFIFIIPVIGWICGAILEILVIIFIIIGLIKILGGERYDVPVVSEWAISLMNKM